MWLLNLNFCDIKSAWVITVNDCLYTEHVAPYSAQKMNESMKEYFRYLLQFALVTDKFIVGLFC